jgi:hypothetical protein
MVSFFGGPADGISLPLRSAPLLLRVAKSFKTGQWDALDNSELSRQVTDSIFVYILDGPSTERFGNGKKISERGKFAVASYRHLCEEPINDDVLRDTAKFLEWWRVNGKRIKEQYAPWALNSTGVVNG